MVRVAGAVTHNLVSSAVVFAGSNLNLFPFTWSTSLR
jgi:hypothetical protein